ncbi:MULTISPECIES: hypothetical protein [unclassified Mammaliicoccus]|uniref:hypothetical protein n=1 Tax=unclassified Mammaliicoccus TaxID=2803851 RepID=UPI001EFA76D7|nr:MULTISPECIES: hypothetical protein [unclassified Mammaliicoccus]
MIKKIYTNKHVFLIDELEEEYQSDAYYGYNLLLSIYVGVNNTKNTHSGYFVFEDKPIRVAKKKDVIKEEKPTELELEFYHLLKKEKAIGYSKKLIKDYQIDNYIIYYEILSDKPHN